MVKTLLGGRVELRYPENLKPGDMLIRSTEEGLLVGAEVVKIASAPAWTNCDLTCKCAGRSGAFRCSVSKKQKVLVLSLK